MKRLLLFLFCCGWMACHSPEKAILSVYLNTGNLPQQIFTINSEKDTLLTSKGGVRIKIAKGTFAAGQAITIEWKEALDFAAMLSAGLTTQSGKELLRSGGMFYFNTKENQTIQKPIEIEVPTETVASKMQLYKGDSSEGKIDWKEPKPIGNVKALGENILGKALFKNNCASCHRIGQDLSGPDLANFQKRGPWRDKQNYYSWMHNPSGFMATDLYTQWLKCKYGVVQQAFPGLSTEALDSIAAYIREETEKMGLTQMNDDNSFDTCIFYHHVYDSLLKERNSLQAINNNTIDIQYNLPPKTTPPTRVVMLDRNSDYYHITIDATGWYNIDALLEMSGTVKSRLIVKLQGAGADKQEIYLAIPSANVVGQGGYLENSTDIGFADVDGGIFLPQQQQAFVFAIGEKKGKFFYSRKEFITGKNQIIYLTAQQLSKEQFDLQMLALRQEGLKTVADTTFQYTNLKTIDEKLDKLLHEKLTNCGCITDSATTIVSK